MYALFAVLPHVTQYGVNDGVREKNNELRIKNQTCSLRNIADQGKQVIPVKANVHAKVVEEKIMESIERGEGIMPP